MSKNKHYFLIIMIIASAFLNIWNILMPLEDFFPKIIAMYALMASAFAVLYYVGDYSKPVSLYYKVFMILLSLVFAGSAMYNLVTMGFGQNKAIAYFISFAGILAFGLLLVLTFATDLGEKNTNTFVWIVIAISFVLLLGNVLMAPGIFRGGTLASNASIIRNASKFTLALACKGMINAKYADKKARGSK